MSTEQGRRALTQGLIDGHEEQYHNDPEFHLIVNAITDLAPVVMDALARDAVRRMEKREAAMRTLAEGGFHA